MLSHLDRIKMGKSVPNVNVPKKTTRNRRKKKKSDWMRKKKSNCMRKNLTRVKDELVVGSDKNSNLVETFNNLLNKSGEKTQNFAKSKRMLSLRPESINQSCSSQPKQKYR